MISTLCKISADHNTCEDTFFVTENDQVIFGGVFDGCSRGINSAFASQLIAYLYKNWTGSSGVVDNYVTVCVASDLNEYRSQLGLTNQHFLATCVLFDYDKQTKELEVRCFGDGVYYVNGVEYVVDQGKFVDYIGEHIQEDHNEFHQYLKKYPAIKYKDVNTFSVCSDGINAIRRSNLKAEPPITDPKTFLLSPIEYPTALSLRFNILKRQGYYPSDDLTIITYEQYENDGAVELGATDA